MIKLNSIFGNTVHDYRGSLSLELRKYCIEKLKLIITGFTGLIVVLIFTLYIYPQGYHDFINYASRDYFVLILMGFPAVTLHEIGHCIFGELSGGKVILTSAFIVIIKARLINYNRYQKLIFGIGGPLFNLSVGFILLLLINMPELNIRSFNLFAYLNIIIGVGALLPVSRKRGGLKYIMDFANNRLDSVY